MTYNVIFKNKTNFQSDPDRFLFLTSTWQHAYPFHALIVKSLPNIANKIFLYLNPL